MAVKDLIHYYEECEEQYKEFKEEMDDFRELCAHNIVSPDMVENAQKMFSVVEDNYKKLSYVIFLLNKPTKKSKYNRYCNQGQNKELLSHSISKEEVVEQNNDAIENMKEIKEELK